MGSADSKTPFKYYVSYRVFAAAQHMGMRAASDHRLAHHWNSLLPVAGLLPCPKATYLVKSASALCQPLGSCRVSGPLIKGREMIVTRIARDAAPDFP